MVVKRGGGGEVANDSFGYSNQQLEIVGEGSHFSWHKTSVRSAPSPLNQNQYITPAVRFYILSAKQVF